MAATTTGAHPSRPRSAPTRGSVPRTRLLHRLASTPAPVVVVSAPAGAGKSTLAAQWAAADPRPHLLIAAGPGVDDPAALAGMILDAFEELGPTVTDARSVVTGQEPDLSTALLPALTALAGSRDRPYVIVVDDLHLLADQRCHAVLRAVCDGVPDGSQVALLSRWRPPEWLARARVEDRLAVLHPADLVLDADEAAALFRASGVTAEAAQVAAAIRATEGWAVGLYLTTLAAREPHPTAATAAGPIHHPDEHVTDYLVTEVLASLDAADVAFLERTSVLDRMTAAACDAALVSDDSAGRLARLRARLQLIVPATPDGAWLRYHHLLGAALRSRLETSEPSLVPVLHARAAAWFAENGDLDTAIRHAKASGDLALTGRIVFAEIESCLGTGRPDRLQQWLSGLDDRALATNRWLALAAAWSAMQTGDGDRMRRWLLTCERFAGRDWLRRAPHDDYSAHLAAIHTVVGTGGLDRLLELTEAALAGLPADRGFRCPVTFIRGVALTLKRQPERGMQLLAEAAVISRALDVPIIEADARSWQGLLAMTAGDWDAAAGHIRSATQVVRDHHLERVAYAAHCITAQALLLAMTGAHVEAATTLSTARRLSAMATEIAPWFAVCGPLVQARTAILLGDGATARTLIDDARAHLTPDLASSLCADILNDAEQALSTIRVAGGRANALTPSELRVLQFLPSHLTFRQIGDHLFLSQNTVKTHALAVYRKLGVTSRAGAVDQAQAVGLLSRPPST